MVNVSSLIQYTFDKVGVSNSEDHIRYYTSTHMHIEKIKLGMEWVPEDINVSIANEVATKILVDLTIRIRHDLKNRGEAHKEISHG